VLDLAVEAALQQRAAERDVGQRQGVPEARAPVVDRPRLVLGAAQPLLGGDRLLAARRRRRGAEQRQQGVGEQPVEQRAPVERAALGAAVERRGRLRR